MCYKLFLKRSQGSRVSSRLLARTLKKAGLDKHIYRLDNASLSWLLHEAYQEYYTVKKSHTSLRQKYLESLAIAVAAQNNLKQTTVIKQLIEREQQQSVARKIRYARGRIRNGSTTTVTVEDSHGGLTKYYKKQDIEREILRNNEEKFRQSHHRPFYKNPLPSFSDIKDSLILQKQC
jgi:hypothetical protein